MNIDRRLRSGEAPLASLAAIWLLTLVCILLAAPARMLPGADTHQAGLLVPGVITGATLAAAMLGLGRTAWRLLGREAAVATAAILPLNPLVLAAFFPGGGQLAAWQLAFTVLMVGALSLRQPRLGAAIAGAAGAAGCLLGDGMWPLAAVAGALLAMRWLTDHRAAEELVSYVKGFAAVMLPILLVEIALTTGLTCAGDRDLLAGAIVIVLGGTMLLKRLPLGPVMLAGGMVVVAGAALAVALAPATCGDPALLVPVAQVVPTSALVLALLPCGAAVLASLYLMRGKQDWLRRWWRDYACLLLAALAGGWIQPELLAVAAGLAAMPLGWLVAQIAFDLGRRRNGARGWRAVGLPLAAGAIVASTLATAAQPSAASAAYAPATALALR